MSTIFRFLDLPYELREEVYHHVWLDTPVIVDRNDIDGIGITYVYKPSAYHGEEKPLPRWLLTCKQILSEGGEVFGLRGQMNINIEEPRWQEIWNKRREDNSYIPFLQPKILQIDHARELYVSLQDMQRDVNVLKSVIKTTAAAGKLRRLSIRLALEQKPWQFVDLSHFAFLSAIVPNLKTLRFAINNFSHNNADDHLVDKAVVGEIKRLRETVLVGIVEKKKKRGGEDGLEFGLVWCWKFTFVRK